MRSLIRRITCCAFKISTMLELYELSNTTLRLDIDSMGVVDAKNQMVVITPIATILLVWKRNIANAYKCCILC